MIFAWLKPNPDDVGQMAEGADIKDFRGPSGGLRAEPGLRSTLSAIANVRSGVRRAFCHRTDAIVFRDYHRCSGGQAI